MLFGAYMLVDGAAESYSVAIEYETCGTGRFNEEHGRR
jgi:hypothetical protein